MRKRVIIFIISFFLIIITMMIIHDISSYYNHKNEIETENKEEVKTENQIKNDKIFEVYEERKADNVINLGEMFNQVISKKNEEIKPPKKIDDWRLTLVNSENMISEGYEIKLAKIDGQREVDARIIQELTKMIQAMKLNGVKDIWVQSAYRSTEYQEEVFNNRVERFMKEGLSKEQAEEMTAKIINRPGTSEHNLGLSVDLNNVDYAFEKTDAFIWLQENAQDYGFVMRYAKEKETITKINYEPWHWRYVGVEHAKKMKELNLCLEEYIEYLSKQ